MATLAHIAGADGQQTIVVTGDLDMLQTVDDTTTVLTTRRGITDLGRYDAAAVRARFELEPHQLPDYRGLKGDPSDNLPGIPGVGEKTAIKLVRAAGFARRAAGRSGARGHAETRSARARIRRASARLPRRLDREARSAADARLGRRALRGAVERCALRALSRARVQGVAREARAAGERRAGFDRRAVARRRTSPIVAATDPPDFERLAERLRDAAAAPRVALALRGEGIGVSSARRARLRVRPRGLAQPAIGAAFAELWERVPHLSSTMRRRVIGTLDLPPRDVADDPMIGAHLLDPARTYADAAQAASVLCTARSADDAAAVADAAARVVHVARAELERAISSPSTTTWKFR